MAPVADMYFPVAMHDMPNIFINSYSKGVHLKFVVKRIVITFEAGFKHIKILKRYTSLPIFTHSAATNKIFYILDNLEI